MKAKPTPATPDADTIAALQALAEESDTHADFLTGVADAFPDLADTYSEWYAAEVVTGGEQQLGPSSWEA